ncbi:MAG TPA: GAF domain-containing sensor histidine kinase [Verrucomicrobiae bacterium]|nr:GAF domain-containing sensor histidine kinase [Verrucomicrobiae bacterium]
MGNNGTAIAAPNLADPKRLDALVATGLLDSPPEETFDRLTRLASSILGAPVSTITLVDAARQFFKSQFGLSEPLATARQTPLSHSFCQYVVGMAEPLVVADAREHPTLRHNLAVRDYNVIAYLGVPLTAPNGQTLGSFCAIDAAPRVWSEREVKILQEIAFTVMSEIELRIVAREFQANFMALRTLEMQRDELVHMLVHDLRNPLGALSLTLESLSCNPKMEAGPRQTLSIALEGADALLAMISEILDVSKAEAGKLNLNLTECSPRTLAERACARIAALAEEAGVTLRVEVAPDVPNIRADGNKLHRVLVNLLSNAVQHTPKGGTVTVRARPADGNILFEIADTGCGIAPESCGKIFEKYGQSALRKLGKVSTGLGLPFCKLAVEAHGGAITVESELQHGTTFRFTIPQ